MMKSFALSYFLSFGNSLHVKSKVHKHLTEVNNDPNNLLAVENITLVQSEAIENQFFGMISIQDNENADELAEENKVSMTKVKTEEENKEEIQKTDEQKTSEASKTEEQ